MGEFSVSVVIATISRPTLARTLGSLRGQAWGPGDEVLVVGDGSQPVARELVEQFGLPGRFVENPGPTGTWGHHARNWVLDTRLARGAYLMALDDDDEYHPGALAAVRRALGENPGRPHIFRMTGHPLNSLLWARPVLEVGNLGTPMLVFPNDPARLGRYGMWGAGDFDFCAQTCAHFPDGPVWREEPVCMVRPWDARRPGAVTKGSHA